MNDSNGTTEGLPVKVLRNGKLILRDEALALAQVDRLLVFIARLEAERDKSVQYALALEEEMRGRDARVGGNADATDAITHEKDQRNQQSLEMFAAAALQGMLASGDWHGSTVNIGAQAYDFAHAMMGDRLK
jgi:hypothetical protein